MSYERRPAFCLEAKCPLGHSDFCKINNWVLSNWLSVAGRKNKRQQLLELAKKDPQVILDACSTGQYHGKLV